MKIAGARSGPDREEKTKEIESPPAEGGTEEFTRVNQTKEPEKENISELDDKSQDARVPPLILFISPEKAEQSPSPKKRKVLHLSPSSPNHNNVIDLLAREHFLRCRKQAPSLNARVQM